MRTGDVLANSDETRCCGAEFAVEGSTERTQVQS